MRSMIGTSTADSAMKMMRIVSTGLWKLNPAAPRGMAGRRATKRAMLA